MSVNGSEDSLPYDEFLERHIAYLAAALSTWDLEDRVKWFRELNDATETDHRAVIKGPLIYETDPMFDDIPKDPERLARFVLETSSEILSEHRMRKFLMDPPPLPEVKEREDELRLPGKKWSEVDPTWPLEIRDRLLTGNE